mmetsp:Transcript_78131/g.253539  ORF Transcript_78131/g.253539 Transcript_78131/m.253539 type:complete len:266 (-) Transcript_78131:5118-5915(-)
MPGDGGGGAFATRLALSFSVSDCVTPETAEPLGDGPPGICGGPGGPPGPSGGPGWWSKRPGSNEPPPGVPGGVRPSSLPGSSDRPGPPGVPTGVLPLPGVPTGVWLPPVILSGGTPGIPGIPIPGTPGGVLGPLMPGGPIGSLGPPVPPNPPGGAPGGAPGGPVGGRKRGRGTGGATCGGSGAWPLRSGTLMMLVGKFGLLGGGFRAFRSGSLVTPACARIRLFKKSPAALRRRISNLLSSTIVVTAHRMTSKSNKSRAQPMKQP